LFDTAENYPPCCWVTQYKILPSTDDKIEKPLNGEEPAESERPANEATNEEAEAAINTYYDKTKSFFDNLSADDLRYPIC